MPQPDVATRFAEDVAEHEVQVLHDAGLYRHLRCKKPGTSFYWFEITTAPGTLTINGDMGTYVFSRLSDMFEFFGSKPTINPQYWGEKVHAASSPIQRYSPQVAAKHAKDIFAEMLDSAELAESELEEAKAQLNVNVLTEAESEEGFRQALDSFAVGDMRFYDTWEWDLRDWDYHYLWCCHAIVWAIAAYRKQAAQAN